MKKVLIVEDDEIILELLRTVFSFHDNYSASFSKDGGEALELARTIRPDLVIIDVQLPTMDGIEVCRRIKADPALSGMKIMILTGMAQESDRLLAEEAGADMFVTKPFRASTIVNYVDQLTGSR